MSNYFPNAIYKNSKVLQVIKIRVDIPMNESQDNFIFETSYPELIYLGLNKEALLKELGYDQWEDILLSVIKRICEDTNDLKDSDLYNFEQWQLGWISFEGISFKKCNSEQVKSFAAEKQRRYFNRLQGRRSLIVKEYYDCKKNIDSTNNAEMMIYRGILNE